VTSIQTSPYAPGMRIRAPWGGRYYRLGVCIERMILGEIIQVGSVWLLVAADTGGRIRKVRLDNPAIVILSEGGAL
jgi:hypothetical protein